jgi:uncharacterized protein YjbI with pentapeptide repeats
MSTRVDDPSAPERLTCSAEDACSGIRVEATQSCLAHLSQAVRNEYLAQLTPGAPLDLRGTRIDQKLLSEILLAVRAEDGVSRLGEVRFNGVRFSEDVEFSTVHFAGPAWFLGAKFDGDAAFGQAKFDNDAGFGGARFSGDAWFGEAQFNGTAGFIKTTFGGYAGFSKAQFNWDTWFSEASFGGRAGFGRAEFSGRANFGEAYFTGRSSFEDARFKGDAWFSAVKFDGDTSFKRTKFEGSVKFDQTRLDKTAQFDGAAFRQAGILGPLVFGTTLSLDGAAFDEAMVIEATGPLVSCIAARFSEAATIRLLSADIALDGTVFVKPSTIAFAHPSTKRHSNGLISGPREPDAPNKAPNGDSAKPKLVSLRRVDTSTLVLADLDLSSCIFSGAHNLDSYGLMARDPSKILQRHGVFASAGGRFPYGDIGLGGRP